MMQPSGEGQNWLNSLPPVVRQNVYAMLQLRAEEQHMNVGDCNSTLYFTKSDEDGRRSPISSGYASIRSTPLRSPTNFMDNTFDYGSGEDSLENLLTKWTSSTTKEEQASVLNRQTSVTAARALLRQLSNTSSSATLVPSRQGSIVSMASTVRQMSQSMNPEMSEFDENEVRKVLYQFKKKPGPDYICHICLACEEHFIQDCPQRYASMVTTPYQGNKQCYGEFQCTKCKRKWKSTKSWSNIGQECSKCPGVVVFPKKQFPIEKAVQQGRLTLRSNARLGSGSESSFSIDRWSDTSSMGASVYGDDVFDRDARSSF